MLRTMITVLLVSLSSLSHADCEGITERLRLALHPDSQADEAPGFSDCKVWPVDPSESLVAFAYSQQGSSFSVPPIPGVGLYDLDVLVEKTESGEILRRLFQKGVLHSDAVALSGITIDTARYTLTREVRSFGVRADFSQHGGSNPIHYQVINLYVNQGKQLKQVLSNLIMFQENAERLGDGCSGMSSVTERKLSIAKTRSHGYTDFSLA